MSTDPARSPRPPAEAGPGSPTIRVGQLSAGLLTGRRLGGAAAGIGLRGSIRRVPGGALHVCRRRHTTGFSRFASVRPALCDARLHDHH